MRALASALTLLFVVVIFLICVYVCVVFIYGVQLYECMYVHVSTYDEWSTFVVMHGV